MIRAIKKPDLKMGNALLLLSIAMVLLSFFSIIGFGLTGASVTAISGGIDSFVNQNAPNVNYGSAQNIVVSEGSGQYTAGVLKFNINSIPSSSTINNAKLKLYFNTSINNPSNSINISIRRITSDWNESEVTWNNKPSYTSEYTNKVTLTNNYGWIEWDVKDFVQGWVNDSYTNYGFAIAPDQRTASTDKRFKSSDYSNDSLHPILEVNYTRVESYTIDGNTVYINDSNVYIRAEPHTIHSSGWVYFNLTSKVYEGDVDVVFGFNTTEVRPRKVELYNPHTVEWNTSHSEIFYNVSSFINTNASCDYGFEYNTFKKLGNYTIPIEYFNETTQEYELIGWENKSAVVCYDNFTNLGNNNYRIEWHQEHSRIEDYVDKTSTLTSIDYNYGGMNKWWYIRNLAIQKDKNYMVRGYVKTPVGLNESSGKYWFAIKPSGETISEAISNDHLYYLDPWWDASWTRCKNISITGALSTLEDFPAFINVSYDSDMQVDWDDIRFVNASCNFGGSELDYEFVENDSVAGEFWVRLPKLRVGGENISMYYGNTGAGSGENPANVWSEYAGVWHMRDNDSSSINDSTSNVNHGAKLDSEHPNETIGKIYNAQDFNGTADYVDCGNSSSFDVTDAITISAWVKPDAIGTGFQAIIGKWEDAAARLFFGPHAFTDFFQWEIDIGGVHEALTLDNVFAADEWIHIVGVYNGSHMIAYKDGTQLVPINAASGDIDTSIVDFLIGGYDVPPKGFFNGTIDEVRVSNINRSADWINMSYQIVENQKNFVVWDAEEEIDSEPPLIDVTEPAKNNTYQSWTHNVTINGTASDETELGYIWINDTRFDWNNTNTSWKFKNNTRIKEKVVFLNITANDSVDNRNSTYFNFTLDSTPPKITPIEPANNSKDLAWAINVTINGTASDNNTDTITINNSKFTWNGTYTSWKFKNNTAIADGVYFVNITANDSAGNENVTYWNFSITTVAKSISIALSDNLTAGAVWNITYLPITEANSTGNNDSGPTFPGITRHNITISASGTDVDVYIRANDNLQTKDEANYIKLANETFSNSTTSETLSGVRKNVLTTNYQILNYTLKDASVIFLKFFLNVSGAQSPGDYNNTIEIKAVEEGAAP